MGAWESVTEVAVKFVFVSLPVMMSAMLGYYVVGCPCLYDASDNFDEEGDEDAKDARALDKFFKKHEPSGLTIIGVSGAVVTLACVVVWSMKPVPEGQRSAYALQTLLFFPQTWLYWFAQTALIQFCPSKRFVQLVRRSGPLKHLTGLTVGLGRWHAARRKTLELVALRVRERGEANFTGSRLEFHRIDGGRAPVTLFYKTFAVVKEPPPRVARAHAVASLKAQLAKAVGGGLLPPRLTAYLHSDAFRATCIARLGALYARAPASKSGSPPANAKPLTPAQAKKRARPLPAAPVLVKLVYAAQQDLLFLQDSGPLSPQSRLLLHPFTTQGWVEAWAQAEGLRAPDAHLNPRQPDAHLHGWVALCRALLMANAASVMARVHGEPPLETAPWGALQRATRSGGASALDHGLALIGDKFVMRFLQVVV